MRAHKHTYSKRKKQLFFHVEKIIDKENCKTCFLYWRMCVNLRGLWPGIETIVSLKLIKKHTYSILKCFLSTNLQYKVYLLQALPDCVYPCLHPHFPFSAQIKVGSVQFPWTPVAGPQTSPKPPGRTTHLFEIIN